MKILQVINSIGRGGGAETFVLSLSVALNRIPGVEIEILDIIPPKSDELKDIARENGITVHSLNSTKWDPWNPWKLAQVINEGNYDVVHVHLFPALYVAGLAKLFHLTRTKLIFTEHSTFNRRMTNPFYRCIDRLVYNQYSHVVAISDKVKANMVRQLNKSNIDTVYNGIDLNAIRDTAPLNIRQELALPEDAYILTMVGRFIASKDYTTLFQSLNYLPENVHVVCVGKGELMDEYKQKIQSERWASKVHFLGLRTDVINILKGSDIIVLSTEYEGFSISMLEGMSCMKPFVASAVPGVADLVDGVAELFEYRNAGQLAEIVKHLMNDRNAYQKIAERCYQFAAQHNIDRVAAKYFSIYNS